MKSFKCNNWGFISLKNLIQGDHIYDWHNRYLLPRVDLISLVTGFSLLAWLMSQGAGVARRAYRRYKCCARELFHRVGHSRHQVMPRAANGVRRGLIEISSFFHQVT